MAELDFIERILAALQQAREQQSPIQTMPYSGPPMDSTQALPNAIPGEQPQIEMLQGTGQYDGLMQALSSKGADPINQPRRAALQRKMAYLQRLGF